MKRFFYGLSPGLSKELKRRKELIIEFWNAFDACDNPGGTSWGVLESLRREVTDCLALDPPDIRKAEYLTARAMVLLS
jgi:hypothetical protein